jgi:membrane-associated protein
VSEAAAPGGRRSLLVAGLVLLGAAVSAAVAVELLYPGGVIAFIRAALDVFLHLDQHLAKWTADRGPWVYVILAAIIFCETGLVVTPFLPGDSLLFAAGALAALDGSPLNVWFMVALLSAAAILGDAVNYAIGYRVGPKVFDRPDSRLLNPRHLRKAQAFYEKYGGRTIILARFVPIVRTFAPFVAGIGKMAYRRFAAFNVVGGVVWCAIFLLAGYFFGNIPAIKRNFHIVIVAIIAISLAPIAIEWWRARRAAT